MNTFITIRIDEDQAEAFKRYCEEQLNRRHSDVIREFITASLEGRLKITPTEKQKEFYNGN